jgi:hypothetical protein
VRDDGTRERDRRGANACPHGASDGVAGTGIGRAPRARQNTGGSSRESTLPTAGLEYPLGRLYTDRSRILFIGAEEITDIRLLRGALDSAR